VGVREVRHPVLGHRQGMTQPARPRIDGQADASACSHNRRRCRRSVTYRTDKLRHKLEQLLPGLVTNLVIDQPRYGGQERMGASRRVAPPLPREQ
jgi:hypothetical protein